MFMTLGDTASKSLMYNKNWYWYDRKVHAKNQQIHVHCHIMDSASRHFDKSEQGKARVYRITLMTALVH